MVRVMGRIELGTRQSGGPGFEYSWNRKFGGGGNLEGAVLATKKLGLGA